MSKRLYKSAVPKSLSVALLSVSLFNSSVLAVHANETIEEDSISQEIVESKVVESTEAIVNNEEFSEDTSQSESEPTLLEESEEMEESIQEVIGDRSDDLESEIEPSLNEDELSSMELTPLAVDMEAPQLISVTTDKQVYQAGETVHVTVTAKEESVLDRAYAGFQNNTKVGPESLFESAKTIYLNSDGNYEAKIEFQLPEEMAATSYRLSYVSLFDNMSNEVTIFSSQSNLISNIEFRVENSNYNDSIAPELIDVFTDKKIYQAGEIVYVTIIAKEESLLDRAYANFQNNTKVGPESLFESAKSIYVNADGNHEAKLEFILPEKMADTSYNLGYISMFDDKFNEITIFKSASETVSKVGFEVLNDIKFDTLAPELLNYYTDKKIYQSGEIVKLTMEIKERHEIESIKYVFKNTTNVGLETISETIQNPIVTKNTSGNYVVSIEITVPETQGATLFNLESISISDNAGNINQNAMEYETYFVEIIEPYTEAELEFFDADKNVENVISLIDSNSGKNLTKVEFYGDVYEERLAEYITNFNTKNNVNYVIESSELISESPITITSGDRVTFSHVQYKRNVYVINTSANKLPEVESPFIPEGTIYSTEPTENVSKNVVVKYGSEILHSYNDLNSESIDTTIRNAMGSLNSEIYYYEDVEIDHSIVWKSINGKFYNGLEKSITIYVAKRPEIKEEKTTKYIPFKTTYTESEDLLVGEEKITQVGKNGIMTSIFKVTYVDGVETGRELVSEVETTKPTNRVITRGVKEVKQEEVKSVVNFKTQKVDNSELLLGTEKVSQTGVVGELTTTYEVTYIRGEETHRSNVSEVITKEPIAEIIQVGTKEIKQEVVNEAVPFDTEYIENSELLVGESNEITAGVAGEQAVTYEVTYVKGKEDSRKAVSYEMLKEPVTRVVEVGSKEVKVESIEDDIPFEIEYIESEELLVGKENIKQDGQKGTETTTFEITYVNGKEVSRKELSTEVTTKPVTQIIEKGIREVRAEVKTEVVPFETETVDNPELLVGEELVSQAGVDGQRTITENVYFVKGIEVDREISSDEVTLAPVNKIIQVGVKEVKTVEVNEVVEFDIEYLDNKEWLVGVEKVITPGANGEVLVTYEITYVSGEEVSRTELSRVVLVAPTTQVVEKGIVEPVKPAEPVKEKTKEEASNSGQQTLPDTGEEKQYAIFSVAVLSILVGLGMIVPRRKED